MTSRTSTRRRRRAPTHDLLARVLAIVESTGEHDAPGRGSVAFGLALQPGDDIDLAVKDLDHADPVQALIGFRAPSSWSAFGLVCSGRAHRLADHETITPSGLLVSGSARATVADHQAAPVAVRMGVVVARSGLVVSGLRTTGAFEIARASSDPPVGRLPDACRRVLGRPTAPPEVPTGPFIAHLWLDQVLAEAAARPGQLTWSDAVDLHLGVAALTGDTRTPLDTPEARLAAGQASVDDELSWTGVRRVAQGARRHDTVLDPEAAAWMDDGMYSREVLGLLPPLDQVLEALTQVLDPSVHAALIAATGPWGLS